MTPLIAGLAWTVVSREEFVGLFVAGLILWLLAGRLTSPPTTVKP